MNTLPLATILILLAIGIVGILLFVIKGNESKKLFLSGLTLFVIAVVGIVYTSLYFLS